jgi:hypothetical protein
VRMGDFWMRTTTPKPRPSALQADDVTLAFDWSVGVHGRWAIYQQVTITPCRGVGAVLVATVRNQDMTTVFVRLLVPVCRERLCERAANHS